MLFGGSGFAALIYEVSWLQMLELVIGSTSASVGILFATFMGGLCAGSALFTRLPLARVHPLVVLAVLETGIAAFGLLIPMVLPLAAGIYVSGAGYGLQGMILRAAVAAAFLLPPAMLMGASLPAIIRWVQARPARLADWALLYGWNTAGAAAGSLCAAFYLLRLYNPMIACRWAAAVNLLVAGAALLLAKRSAWAASAVPAVRSVATNYPILVSAALSGACALAAEVLWTRLMSTVLLATVYALAILLAVFLIGLALGGVAAERLLLRLTGRSQAAQALGWCQILLIPGILWASWMVLIALPEWSGVLRAAGSPARFFALQALCCVIAILPAAVLWGASFPLACSAAMPLESGDPSRTAGTVYVANTLGAICGALAMSLVLIPSIGSQNAFRVLAIGSAIGGCLALWSQARPSRIFPILATAATLALVLPAIPALPGEMIAYGRHFAVQRGRSDVVQVVEGRGSSAAISHWPNGVKYFSVNGHVQATTEIYDMRLQRLVAHLPGVLHKGPRSVLGIGFGAGVTAGAFTRYPDVQSITICEIEPVIPPLSGRHFASENYGIYQDQRTRLVFDDARHYLLTTRETFDIIASDPLDVFAKGTAALYTKEYFDSARRHLNPGGYFSLYVALYEADVETIRTQLATFFAAFPHGSVWLNTRLGKGYDLVLLGQQEQLAIPLETVRQKIASPAYAQVRASLEEIGMTQPFDLFSGYAGRGRDIGRWSAGAEINTDANLRLSYLAGWSVNKRRPDEIHQSILGYGGARSEVFQGSAELLQALSDAVEKQQTAKF